jgi:hypothetical protein
MVVAMAMTLRNSPLLRLGAALLLAVAGLALARALVPPPAPAAPAVETAFVSPAAARALGARWRETRRPEAANAYAQALLGAGLNNELLTAVATEGLFRDDEFARTLFRAEALLRLYRYEDAAALAASPAVAENPYAAFIRVRAIAGLGRGLDREALALATRGPDALAREAWLLRARTALDDNDFETVDASLKRASEAGATAARLETYRIERDIRAGETARAREALDARARALSRAAIARGEAIPDFEGWRLSAMLSLRAGDGREAGRFADRALLAAPGGRDAPLAALAKWTAGDAAQASAILSAHLRAVPGDGTALDLAAALAFADSKHADGEAMLAALGAVDPRLAAFRRYQRAAARRDFDAALSALDGFSGEAPPAGAAAVLVGPGAALPFLPEALRADAMLATLAAASEPRSVRKASAALLDLRRSPIDLAVAAAALERIGDGEGAAKLAREGAAAGDFFAPVALQSKIAEAAGRGAEALALHDRFLAANPARADAALSRALVLARTAEPSAAAKAFAALAPAVAFSTDEAAQSYAQAATGASEEMRAIMLAAAAGVLPPDRLARVRETARDDAGAAIAWREALIDAPWADDLAERYRAAMTRQGREADAQAFLAAVARRSGAPDRLREAEEANF